MILDASGKPFPEKSHGQLAEALARSRRNTKLTLTAHILAGWTTAQHRHWVKTGEAP